MIFKHYSNAVFFEATRQVSTDEELSKNGKVIFMNEFKILSFFFKCWNLSMHNINDAIEVFKLNVKLHPNSWNPYDSLGETYALAGNKDLAIENYETSIKLNPKSDTGKEALKKLSKQ